jgi:hypothetical protein
LEIIPEIILDTGRAALVVQILAVKDAHTEAPGVVGAALAAKICTTRCSPYLYPK